MFGQGFSLVSLKAKSMRVTEKNALIGDLARFFPAR